MHRSTPLPLVLLASLIAAGCHLGGSRQSEDAFAWSGVVPGGQTLYVNNLRGDITVVPALSGEVLITAEKHWRGRRSERVRVITKRGHGGMVVCALWGNGECSSRNYHAGSRKRFIDRFTGRGETQVEFTVAIPRGVRLFARTTSGNVHVTDAHAPITIRTVNGDIDARTQLGPVSAETVNGSIEVRVDSLPPNEGVELETVNGSVVAVLPQTLWGRLDASTVNGTIESDIPLEFGHGRVGRRGHASFGGEGRLSFTTVNGGIALRQGS